MKARGLPLLAGVVAFFGVIGCASSPSESEPASTPPVELAIGTTETIVDRAFLRGLVALKLGDYERVREQVGQVAAACTTAPIGGRALLTLAAAELDPRNPAGDPQLARQLIERFFQVPEKPAWTEPLAETLFLLALDRGGGARPESAVHTAEPSADRERAGRAAEELEDPDVYVPARQTRPPEQADEVAPERAEQDPLRFLASRGFVPTPEECVAATGALRGGPLEAPILPRMPLAEQMVELVRVRDSLQARADARERELAELRQELERIRETLRP